MENGITYDDIAKFENIIIRNIRSQNYNKGDADLYEEVRKKIFADDSGIRPIRKIFAPLGLPPTLLDWQMRYESHETPIVETGRISNICRLARDEIISRRRNESNSVSTVFNINIKDDQNIEGSVKPSNWTGVKSRSEQLILIRNIIPNVYETLGNLILELDRPGANGGPILDEKCEAIDNLRDLHNALGELLILVDESRFDDELGQGLLADAIRYAKNAKDILKNDPIPYMLSSLIFATLYQCDLGGAAGYISGLALSLKKPNKKK